MTSEGGKGWRVRVAAWLLAGVGVRGTRHETATDVPRVGMLAITVWPPPRCSCHVHGAPRGGRPSSLHALVCTAAGRPPPPSPPVQSSDAPPLVIEPLRISKVNTALQLSLCAVALASAASAVPLDASAAVPLLAATTAATTVGSFGGYVYYALWAKESAVFRWGAGGGGKGGKGGGKRGPPV